MPAAASASASTGVAPIGSLPPSVSSTRPANLPTRGGERRLADLAPQQHMLEAAEARGGRRSPACRRRRIDDEVGHRASASTVVDEDHAQPRVMERRDLAGVCRRAPIDQDNRSARRADAPPMRLDKGGSGLVLDCEHRVVAERLGDRQAPSDVTEAGLRAAIGDDLQGRGARVGGQVEAVSAAAVRVARDGVTRPLRSPQSRTI